MEARSADVVQSVERCFAVLEGFEQLPAGSATISSLAEVTGLSRPTVRRMLLTLEHMGFTQLVGTHWVLRPQILRFSHWFTRSSALVTVAEQHAQWASRQLHEAIAVSQVDGFDVYVVSIARTGEQMTVRAEVGQRIPLHATAAGWITMAWAETLPDIDRPQHTQNTITDPLLVIKRSKQVRADKYVISDQEILDGMIDTGVPVLTPHGWLLGALSVALPSWDWSTEQIRDRVIPVLATASRRITNELTQSSLHKEANRLASEGRGLE